MFLENRWQVEHVVSEVDGIVGPTESFLLTLAHLGEREG
jgi:hypothetical protein